MQVVKYSALKLALAVAAGVAMLAFSFVLLDSDRGKHQFAGVIFLLVGPILTLGSLKLLLGSDEALRFDRNGLEVQTMWRSAKLAWRDVSAVGIATVTTHAFFGLIKTGSNRSLEIRVGSGLLGSKKYALSRGFLAISEAEFLALPDAMEAVSQGAPAPQHAQQARQPQPAAHLAQAAPLAAPAPADYRPPSSDDTFDPDAALARYMERKTQAEREQAAAPPPAPTLNGAPLPRAAGGARPAFGRKGVDA